VLDSASLVGAEELAGALGTAGPTAAVGEILVGAAGGCVAGGNAEVWPAHALKANANPAFAIARLVFIEKLTPYSWHNAITLTLAYTPQVCLPEYVAYLAPAGKT